MWQAPCGAHASHDQEPAVAMEVDEARPAAVAKGRSGQLLKAEVDGFCHKIVQGMKVGLFSDLDFDKDSGLGLNLGLGLG